MTHYAAMGMGLYLLAVCCWSKAGVKEALFGGPAEDATPNTFQYVANWVRHGVPAPKDMNEVVQYAWLAGFGVLCVVAYAVDPVGTMWLLNAWDLGVCEWVFFFSVKQYLLWLYNAVIMAWIRSRCPRLEAPDEGLELTKLDFFYLRVNAPMDMSFLSVNTYLWVEAGLWFDTPDVLLGAPWWLVHQVACTAVSAMVVLTTTDALYSLLHMLMHSWEFLSFNAIHRHHHRIVRPQDGLVDVRNYHPLELFLSMLPVVLGFYFAKFTVGVTMWSALIAFALQVAANIADHSDHDVKFLLFSSADHEMHHRLRHVNMGICLYFVDRLMGTYRPYQPAAPEERQSTGETGSALSTRG